MMTSQRSEIAELSETFALAEQIRGLCSVVTKIARTDLESVLKRQNCGISAIEHGVLRHLSHGVTSMAEISRLMGVAPSTLVYVVDGLTKKKLVKRSKDLKDRRKEPLLLEKKGAEAYAESPKVDSASTLVRSLEKMPAAHRRELVALLGELAEGLTGTETAAYRYGLGAREDVTGAGQARENGEEGKS